MIHSVYVYNGDSGTFYTNLLNHVYTRDAFFDKEIVAMLDNFPKDMKLMPIPRKISNSFLLANTDMISNVYTYVFFDEPLRDGHVRRAVIINISEEWIRETIRSMSTDSDSSIFIINDAGMTVSGNSTIDLLTDLSDKDYVQDILKSAQHSNYGLYTVAGVKTLVSFVKSSALNWTFVRLTPVNIINNQLRAIQLASLIFCILILIIGFFFSHLMFKNLYKPVNVMLTKLQSLDSEKKNLYQLKQDFLNRLLNGSLSLSFEEFQGRCTEYDLPFKTLDDFSLVIFKIDNYSAFKNDFNMEERALIK